MSYMLNAFVESNLQRMFESYPHASADIFSNVKLLLMCQQSGPAPTWAGEPAYLGRARPESLLSGSHAVLNQKGDHQGGPLCAGALYQSEGAHSFALMVGRISLTQLKSLS